MGISTLLLSVLIHLVILGCLSANGQGNYQLDFAHASFSNLMEQCDIESIYNEQLNSVLK